MAVVCTYNMSKSSVSHIYITYIITIISTLLTLYLHSSNTRLTHTHSTEGSHVCLSKLILIQAIQIYYISCVRVLEVIKWAQLQNYNLSAVIACRDKLVKTGYSRVWVWHKSTFKYYIIKTGDSNFTCYNTNTRNKADISEVSLRALRSDRLSIIQL